MEAGLIAVEQREGTAGAGEGFKGDGEAVAFVEGFKFVISVFLLEPVGLVVHFLLEEGGFDRDVTGQAPLCGRELVHQVGFGLALGKEMVEVGAGARFDSLRRIRFGGRRCGR